MRDCPRWFLIKQLQVVDGQPHVFLLQLVHPPGGVECQDDKVALASIGLVYKIIDKYTISDITQGIKDIVNLAVDVLPSAAESISQAINSMGSGVVATILNVDELSSNEEIASQRKVNALRYLSLYYNSLFNDLGYEAILSEDGTQIIGVKPYSYDDKGSKIGRAHV